MATEVFTEDTCIACKVIFVGEQKDLTGFKEYFDSLKMGDGYSSEMKNGYLELLIGYDEKHNEKYVFDKLTEEILDNCHASKVFVKITSHFASTSMDRDSSRYAAFTIATSAFTPPEVEEASWEFLYTDYDSNADSYSVNEHFIKYLDKKLELFLIENNITKGSAEEAKKACEAQLKDANEWEEEYRNKDDDDD